MGASFCPKCGESVSSVSQLPTNLASASVAEAARRRGPGGFTPGAILGERYRIIGLLGRGGMGEVYRADDLKLGQPVALKFLPRRFAADRDHLERFYSEVRIARQVSHPNVCRVYDVGEMDGQHYLSMEYVDGEDLASLLKRIGRLPPDKALDIARELCAGLAAAHELGVLHRDLKPANVMVDGRGRARITDFGLAIAASDAVEGEVSGTPAYMAPEQFVGKGATVRSDIYSLGLVLYELSTGRKAFEGATFQDLKRKHAEDLPAPPSTIAPGLDPAAERVILRCLEKEPTARPASAAQIAAALPGGDPLAAALAAGETPSPEMVAAAGAEGALEPAKAWAMLGAAVVILGAVVGLARFSMDQGLAPFPKSPEFLTERSRELIRSFGYTSEPADEASWWDRRYDYLSYRAAHEPSTRWWRSLARTEPHPWWFWYRQSPRFLVPENPFGEPPIRPTDPPLEVSGMVNLALDARGNLMRLRAVPPQVEGKGASAESPAAPDWKPLFAAAGLDFERFSPSPPRWLPSEPFDTRADWDGAYASSPDVPIHVAAAAWRGRPVFFEVLGPWNIPERMQEQAQAAGLVVSNYGFLVFIVSAWAAALFLARRNLRLGRGDRRGAIRIATFVFSGTVLSWIFSAHHVPSQDEGWMFLNFVATAVYLGAVVWLVVHRDRADRAAKVARAAVFLEPAALRTVPGSARGARRARGDPHRCSDDAHARDRVLHAQLGRSGRHDADASASHGAQRRRGRVSTLLGVLRRAAERTRGPDPARSEPGRPASPMAGHRADRDPARRAPVSPARTWPWSLRARSRRPRCFSLPPPASGSSPLPSPCSWAASWRLLHSRWKCPAGTRHADSSSSGWFSRSPSTRSAFLWEESRPSEGRDSTRREEMPRRRIRIPGAAGRAAALVGDVDQVASRMAA